MSLKIESQVASENLWRRWSSDKRVDAYLSLGLELELQEIVQLNHGLIANFMFDVGIIEVALRNKLSVSLNARLVAQSISAHWTLDPSGELGSLSGGDLTKQLGRARLQASQSKRSYSEDDVVAEITLGFWNSLLSRKYQAINVDLIGAFRGNEDRNIRAIANSVNRLRVFRNRISHGHRILHLDLKNQHLSNIQLATQIDPELGKYLEQTSGVQVGLRRLFEARKS